MSNNIKNPSLAEQFYSPVSDILPGCAYTRVCPKLNDERWLQMGVSRVLESLPSGRAFLQKWALSGQGLIGVSHFFSSLKSQRRLDWLTQINRALVDKANDLLEDPLSSISSLADYEVFAGDGHYHKASAHEPYQGEKKYPSGHFYSLNLRTHTMSHLCSADSNARKREHDMRALKRLGADVLRQGTKKGRKVLYVWDCAGISFHQWHHWKHQSGLYFLSREKDNMQLEVIGVVDVEPCSLNRGVLADERVGSSCSGTLLRRIRYQCPIEGKNYHFITNEMKLPPGVLAFLYKMRWDIEKAFDSFKNKLTESKAWAASMRAKSMQGQFMCLAHNLLQLLEHTLKKQGIKNHKEDKRRKKRLHHKSNQAQNNKAQLPQLYIIVQRATQRTSKLIRWLRHYLFEKTSFTQAKIALRHIYDYF